MPAGVIFWVKAMRFSNGRINPPCAAHFGGFIVDRGEFMGMGDVGRWDGLMEMMRGLKMSIRVEEWAHSPAALDV